MVGPAGTLVVIDTKSDLKAFVGETLVGDVHINLFNVHCMLGIFTDCFQKGNTVGQPNSALSEPCIRSPTKPILASACI